MVGISVRVVLIAFFCFLERNAQRHIPLVVCGDFNGGPECGAVRYLEDGFIDEKFREDGDPVTSGRKELPFEKPLIDVAAAAGREVPTLVVSELISLMTSEGTYGNHKLSDAMIERLTRIYDALASYRTDSGKMMSTVDVEKWLLTINKQLGRGSEFRAVAKEMGWKDGGKLKDDENSRIELPRGGLLSLEGFINVYQQELKQGKFWGIAYDMDVLQDPLPNAGLFTSRFDRMYCSTAIRPTAFMEMHSNVPCPNGVEPSDHLPVAASFTLA
jgi:hypothetical protein